MIRKPGRPLLKDRQGGKITELEYRYADLRSSGLSIAAASEALGMPEKEMAHRERVLTALRVEIDSRRKEKNVVDPDELISLNYKILKDLEALIKEKLLTGQLSINEIANLKEVLHSTQSDLDTLNQLQRQQQTPKEDEGSTGQTFNDLIRGIFSFSNVDDFREFLESMDTNNGDDRLRLILADPARFLEKLTQELKDDYLREMSDKPQPRLRRRRTYTIPITVNKESNNEKAERQTAT